MPPHWCRSGRCSARPWDDGAPGPDCDDPSNHDQCRQVPSRPPVSSASRARTPARSWRAREQGRSGSVSWFGTRIMHMSRATVWQGGELGGVTCRSNDDTSRSQKIGQTCVFDHQGAGKKGRAEDQDQRCNGIRYDRNARLAARSKPPHLASPRNRPETEHHNRSPQPPALVGADQHLQVQRPDAGKTGSGQHDRQSTTRRAAERR